ncbi:putative GTP-binding protein EngB [bioreactor metagenome]|jgi:ribosome biogenesis GTP-binding protein YsxC/EngB|uniref:Putative GTP-binding protein EngB n=1 Tax=bioreactor metagenome TaxID=1076179 RepID=A0A644UJD5_9ZZZZ|nr:ribosome biogenesis GTP-binding protein YihA/YsxC [Acidaminococcaceae bacterium]NLU43726.1 YihA family ribosome biogenesis GTP-binding protein [Acholeplasmataceae bacterium]
MNLKQWDLITAKYLASAVNSAQYPVPPMEEIAFIGRSNVGKSSLINSLTRCRGLARVSGSPGKTQTLNFYELCAKRMLGEVEDRRIFHLVDLPGYGFARTAKDNREQWSAFIGKYLENSENLKMVCQLIDIRHKPMDSDIACYHWLMDCQRPTMVVLTKADKLSKGAGLAQKEVFKREFGLDDSRIITYSSTAHTMRNELITRVMDYID